MCCHLRSPERWLSFLSLGLMTRVVLVPVFLASIYYAAAQDVTVSPSKHAAIKAPRPDYSFEARSHWLEGRGLFILSVRPDGTVESVDVSKSTGHPELDQSAVAAFQRWQFRPGSVTKVKIPMEFTLAGLRPAAIDSALRAEKRGSAPPRKNSSWDEYWRGCIASWRAYHRPDYEDYFRKRRQALGLPEITPAQKT
jgi:TonB family protein